MNLLFDLDGTLTDPTLSITRSLSYAFEKVGIPPMSQSELVTLIGPPIHDTFAQLMNTSDRAAIDRGVAFYRERYAAKAISEETTVYDGIPELLTQLRSHGHKLFVATSKAREFAEAIVAGFGLKAHFKTVWGAELDGRLSNKGELIAHILNEEGLRAHQCLMIGDRMHDTIGARKNGMRSLGVTWGFGSSEELLSNGAEAVAHSPAELARLIIAASAC